MRSILTNLIIIFLCQRVSATCYYRNGSAALSVYEPCSSDASDPLSNVCCGGFDTCLANGLCMSGKDIWRHSCAKKDWSEGGCQEACSTDRKIQTDGSVVMTPCDGEPGNTTSTRWCCGTSTACCAEDSGIPVVLLAQQFGNALPVSSSSSELPAKTLSEPPAQASSDPPAQTSNSSPPGNTESTRPDAKNESGLSTGAKAGIGVGVSVGVVILVALSIFVVKAMKWRERLAAMQGAEQDHGLLAPMGHNGKTPLPEVEAATSPYEMAAVPLMVEAPIASPLMKHSEIST